MTQAILSPGNDFCKIDGEGPPVVLIGGLISLPRNWIFQILRFKNKYKLISLATGTLARLNPHDESLTIEAMSVQLHHFLDEIDIGKCCLVGSSMGAMVALEYSSSHAERVCGLVLSSMPLQCRGEMLNWFAHDLTQGLQGLPRHFYDFVGKYFFSTKFVASEGFKSLPSLGGLKTATFTLKEVLNELEAAQKWIEQRKWHQLRIACPTLIVYGSEDRLTSPDMLSQLLTQVESAPTNMRVINGAGHAVHIEKPKEYNLALSEFLAAVHAIP